MKPIVLIGIMICWACVAYAQEVGMLTDKGRQRAENEDCCDYFHSGQDLVCIVCDGVGGAVGGRVASTTAVAAIRHYLENNTPANGVDNIRPSLTAAIMAGHEAILQRAQADSTLRNMASTCLIALIRDKTVYYSHVGDCRLYRMTCGGMQQLTKDDSYMDYLIEKGEITPREAKKHPLRRAIYNALGVEGITPHSGGAGFRLEVDEYVLMCSDGLYGEVKDARIRRIVRRSGGDCTTIVRNLVAEANKAGGRDNITAIVLKEN